MLSSTNQYVGMNVNTSCVQLSEKAAYVNLEAVDAPEYASFASAHKRLAYNNNALAMNPLNFFAEMKDEGNPITKANYEADYLVCGLNKIQSLLVNNCILFLPVSLMVAKPKPIFAIT